MLKIKPTAFAYLDQKGNVCYTGNLKGPLAELEELSQYGRRGSMLPLITETQHRAATVALLNSLKSLLDNPS